MQLFRSIGVLNRKRPTGIKPLPLLLSPDGQPLDNTAEIAKHWRTYFSEQEDGVETTFTELMAEADRQAEGPVMPPGWHELPSRYQFEEQFHRISSGKAFFADGIPGDLLKKMPAKMAELFYTLYLKEVIYLREPLLHKGGYLVAAYKNGDARLMSNYRSLFVSSVIAKALHSIYRRELAHAFQTQRLPMQVGGLPKQGITQPVHVLHLFQQAALHKKTSTAFLFIDVSNAFYRLVREHIVCDGSTQRTPEELFRALDLPHECLEEFAAMLAQPAAIDASPVPDRLKLLFQEFYRNTWFVVRNDSAVVQTRRGSRPGDSFADLCFSFALTKILQAAIAEALEAFPDLHIEWDGQAKPFVAGPASYGLEPLMPIWADDVAVAMEDKDTSRLLQKASKVSQIILDRLMAAGLKPNMAHGKTELLLELRGPGSVQLRRQLAKDGYMLHIDSRYGKVALHIVGAYRHLGTWLQNGGGVQQDVLTRFAIAHDTLTRFRGQIFANRGLGFEQKKNFFTSLVMSTIVFNCAVWTPRNRRQHAAIEHAFFRLYRRFAVLHFGQSAMQWGADRLYRALAMPKPHVVLIIARLRYLSQLLHSAQPHTWAMLQRNPQWYRQLQADIAWFDQLCPEKMLLDSFKDSWDAFAQAIGEHSTRWKNWLRAAMARHISTLRLEFEWHWWHGEIMKELLLQGYQCLPRQYHTDPAHFCLKCKRTFARRADLAVHSFKMHQRLRHVRLYVTGEQCEHCLKTFEQHLNLLNHVNNNESCLLFYQHRGLRVEAQPGVNSRAAKQKQKVLSAPFMQAEGPLCQPPVPVNFQDDERRALCASWTQTLSQTTDHDDLLERLRVLTCQTCLYPEEIVDTFRGWWEQVLRDELVCLACLAVGDAFLFHASGEWFMQGEVAIPSQHTKVEEFFFQEAQSLQEVNLSVPCEPRYAPCVFAHLFSGARRAGDFQQHVERLGAVAVSIDIIYDITWGDLLKPETFLLFDRALRQGVLRGFLAGPPCETWTRARAVLSEVYHVRPVRSRARPYGLCCLTRKESEQVLIGTKLLGVALRLFVTALLVGATAVIEHPSEPHDIQDYASIWRLPLVRFLLRFPRCQLLSLFQGHFGGLSPKPTSFLVANCEGLEAALIQGRTTPLPKGGCIGRDQSGEWKTNKLKEYPSDLCKVLAEAFLAAQPLGRDFDSLPDWFLTAIQSLRSGFDESAPRGPDFCRIERKGQ